MNSAHWHLLLNHLPVLGIPFGLGLLLASLRRQTPTLQRAGLTVMILASAVAALVYLTGEPAEEALEQLAIRPTAAIERHEDAAAIALVLAGVLGVLAAGALWRFRRGALGRGAVFVLLLLGTAVSGTFAWVANLGGQIRHPEIRSASTLTAEEKSEDER